MFKRLIGILCVLMMMSAPASAQTSPTTAQAKSIIAVFTLHGAFTESPAEEQLPLFGPLPESLRDLLDRMQKAGNDANVKAVVIVNESPMLGFAQIEEIRQAMQNLQKKGKDVYAYGDAMTFPGYVLMTGASRVSIVPSGIVVATGISAETLYLRRLLDKIGVQPDFMTCGDYKSAAELFMQDGPSPQADEMHNWLFDSIFNTAIEKIASGRKVELAQAKKWIDTGLYTAARAKTDGLIDAVETRQELAEVLKQKFGADIQFDRKYGRKQERQMDLSSPVALFQVLGEMMAGGKKAKPTKPAVGIVYVDGAIQLGRGEPSIFGSSGAFSSDIRKALDEAAKDDSIKAVVMRVSSPGGSATASEIILQASRGVRNKKPLIVSMGNVAGSGGYYVACGAGTIFADPSTITGSIGVVSGKLVTTDMWNKIGVTWKEYKRGANAGIFSSTAPLTEAERKQVREMMDEIYNVFKQHVTENRNGKLSKPIDEIAGGRVYTGKQAMDLGLVDRLGSLQDAIVFAAGEAKLDTYDVRVVPEPKNFIEKLMQSASGADDDRGAVSIKRPGTSLVDLVRPHLQGLGRQRVQTVIESLEKLQLLEQDRVLMIMPEATPR